MTEVAYTIPGPVVLWTLIVGSIFVLGVGSSIAYAIFTWANYRWGKK